MNFDLTDEQQMLSDGLQKYLQKAVTPKLLASASATPEGHARELWTGLVEMGVPGALFTEEDGGFGGGGFDISVVFEALGRSGAFEPLLETGVMAGGLIAALGTAEQRGLIDDIIGGAILVLAHGEAGSRYRLDRVATTAVRHGDGWRLNGQKTVVVAAPAASHLIVSARVSGSVTETAGITLFIVPVETPGLTLRSYPIQAGGRAAEIDLTVVELDESARLGPEGGAFEAIERMHARAVAAQCAEAVGLMDAIRTLTVDYLRTRSQFGQPIGKFQALQHRMADLLIEIEQARSAVINVCGHLDAPRRERERQASAAKNLVARTAQRVVEEAIQMHGGIGMTMEYALGHLAKRLTMVEHRFGDADWHLERFIRLSAA